MTDEPADEPAEYGLVLPFDSDDPTFTRGFEVGVIWGRMYAGERGIIQTVHASNTEMVIRMAEETGYTFRAEPLNDDWLAVYLEKGKRK